MTSSFSALLEVPTGMALECSTPKGSILLGASAEMLQDFELCRHGWE
jgi:hypothetical protein